MGIRHLYTVFEARRFSGLVTLATSLITVAGCSGGSSGLALLHPTPRPTPRATSTPVPALSPLVGSYVGTFSVTFDPHSAISGTITHTLKFVIARDGKLTVSAPQIYTTGQQPPPPVAQGTCDLRTGAIDWDQPLYFGNALHFSGQLHRGANGLIAGGGGMAYQEQMELATGTWSAHRL